MIIDTPRSRVIVNNGAIQIIVPTADGYESVVSMQPKAAEELAHALLICARVAGGHHVSESEIVMVKQWVLR